MATYSEKPADAQIEHLAVKGSDFSDTDDFTQGFTPAEQRKIIHRIDRRLVTTVGLMYCVSLMDRTNLSAAAIAGMTKDLKLIGYRYVRPVAPPNA